MKAILLGSIDRSVDSIPYAQLFPFFDNRRHLREMLGLDFQHVNFRSLQSIDAVSQQVGVDVFFVRPFWQEEPADLIVAMKRLRVRQPDAQIIFIDPFDQTSSRFFGVLPYVDQFLKYQALKDISLYRQPLKGGTVLTDYLVRELGYDLKDWSVTSEIPQGYESRIKPGWFISLAKDFQAPLFRRPRFWQRQPERRDIDVFCHVSYGQRDNLEWYGRHRMLAIAKLQRLASDYTLSVSGDFAGEKTVSSRQYFKDIKRSRIAFSPFGWGEITWRDYEAVCHGCLLIKPAVDHIAVEPNIFIPGQTYVPVRWDFADLEETCRYYLAHPELAAQIAQNARQAYQNYFTEKRFVQRMGEVLRSHPAVKPTPDLVSTSSKTVASSL